MQEAFLLIAMALCAGAALVLCFLHWKAQRVDPGLPHQKAQRVDPGLLHRMAQRLNRGPLHQKYSMRVSTILSLAAMALTLGFGAMYFQPASMVALMGQQQRQKAWRRIGCRTHQGARGSPTSVGMVPRRPITTRVGNCRISSRSIDRSLSQKPPSIRNVA